MEQHLVNLGNLIISRLGYDGQSPGFFMYGMVCRITASSKATFVNFSEKGAGRHMA
jgi:hypothetical protein